MRALATVSVLAASIGLPATAYAAQDGAIVDPSTPAGKEYAIPLEQARHDSGGGGGSGVRATAARESGVQAAVSSLFGQGISPRPGGSTGKSSAGGGGRSATGPAGQSGGQALPTGDASAATKAGERLGRSAGTRVLLGIPLGALLLGATVWLVLGRRARRQD